MEGREELVLHSSGTCLHLNCQSFLGKWLLWWGAYVSTAPFPMAKCQVTKVSGLLKLSEKLISLSSLVLYSWRAKFYFCVSCHADQRLLTRSWRVCAWSASTFPQSSLGNAPGFRLSWTFLSILLCGPQMKSLGNNFKGHNSEKAFLNLQQEGGQRQEETRVGMGRVIHCLRKCRHIESPEFTGWAPVAVSEEIGWDNSPWRRLENLHLGDLAEERLPFPLINFGHCMKGVTKGDEFWSPFLCHVYYKTMRWVSNGQVHVISNPGYICRYLKV